MSMLKVRDCASAAEVMANARAVKARMRALSAPPSPSAPPAPVIEVVEPAPPPPVEHKPRWLQIVDAVALECGVSRADILGPSRRARIAEARHLAIYVVHDVIRTLSLPVAGRLFGGRDHTTVLYALRKIAPCRRAGI
jgi:chromosomal replication initiator protein